MSPSLRPFAFALLEASGGRFSWRQHQVLRFSSNESFNVIYELIGECLHRLPTRPGDMRRNNQIWQIDFQQDAVDWVIQQSELLCFLPLS